MLPPPLLPDDEDVAPTPDDGAPLLSVTDEAPPPLLLAPVPMCEVATEVAVFPMDVPMDVNDPRDDDDTPADADVPNDDEDTGRDNDGASDDDEGDVTPQARQSPYAVPSAAQVCTP